MFGNELDHSDDAAHYATLIKERVHDKADNNTSALSSTNDRAEWMAAIWDDDLRERDRRSRLLIEIGDVYAGLGDYAGAINQYLVAAKFATWGNTNRFLAERYQEVALKCRPDDSTLRIAYTQLFADHISNHQNICDQ